MTESALVAIHRALNPRSRAVGILRLIRNSSATKQYGCVLCGAEGPTFSARWPETVRSREWGATHRASHLTP